MVNIVISIIGVLGYLAVTIHAVSLLVFIIVLIKNTIIERKFHKPSFLDLTTAIFFGPYGAMLVNTENRGEKLDKLGKNMGKVLTVFMIFGLSIIILPKIGQGTETVGSPFENENYVSYHYATLTEADEDFSSTSVDIFGIAEIKRNDSGRWIENVFIDNYGTFHAYSAEGLEVFEALIPIQDIDGKNYKVRVLALKPELRLMEDLYTKVAGVTFNNDDGVDRQEILKQMKDGDKTITLIRHKENSFDKDAVIVSSNYGALGYIDNELAPLIASNMDNGKIVKAAVTEITGGEGGKENLGCNLHIKFYRVVEKDNYRPEGFDERN